MMRKRAMIPNQLILLAMLILLVASVESCLLYPIAGPGYAISIEVNDPNFKKRNTAQFEEIAFRENFYLSQLAQETDWYCIYYRSSVEEYKLLTVWISYHKNEHSLNVVVMNDWTGQKMKEEIERIADLYIAAMAETYGMENVKVLRQRIGPPM